jgi:LAO/AO transport system kinase
VVVEVPEMGDEIQAIKAGLLEVADIVAVNKADRPGAEHSARQLRAMLAGAGGRFAAPPPILLTTATTGDGIAALADAIDADRKRSRSPEQALIRARNQLLRAIAEGSRRSAEAHPQWESTVAEIAKHQIDPITAAERLLES